MAFATREAAHPRTGLESDTDEEEELVLELTLASNVVVDMVKAGQLDDAEQAAHELLERFPDAHDGYDRLGMVYEAPAAITVRLPNITGRPWPSSASTPTTTILSSKTSTSN